MARRDPDERMGDLFLGLGIGAGLGSSAVDLWGTLGGSVAVLVLLAVAVTFYVRAGRSAARRREWERRRRA